MRCSTQPVLLHLCARATTFKEHREQLAKSLDEVTHWDALLNEAEQQGVAPLLHWHLRHLGKSCPAQFRRAIHLLNLRHYQNNRTYLQVLREVLEIFRDNGIDALVLKGAALCQTIYPEISLRPMRDVDLLVRAEQSQTAQQLLINNGFSESTAPRPIDHFHLPSLHRKADNISLCFELHHGLFPNCPPYYHKTDFNSLFERATSINLNGIAAYCPGNEDMLWHVFEHGLRMPLTYEPYKLITVADIVTLVETQFEKIDWERLRYFSPKILAALPFLHFITPWQDHVLNRFSWKAFATPAGVGETFRGWPHLRLSEQKDRSLFTILRNTFLPPEWWLKIYYGIGDRWWKWFICRWFTHPRHVFWWIRLYSTYLVEKQDGITSSTDAVKEKSVGGKIRMFRNKAISLLGKFR